MASVNSLRDNVFNKVVVIVSLGFFVDVFDMMLFSVLRTRSLTAIGVTDTAIVGGQIMSMQMAAMLVGGICWGMFGDTVGRTKALYWSIALYSVASIANAFVTTVPQYMFCRVLAGFGLAGELGAAVTMIGETMTPRSRGWGDTAVSVAGVLGGVAAALTAHVLPWRLAYVLGGLLGLVLMLVRGRLPDPYMYRLALSHWRTKKFANLNLLFTLKYIRCVLIGVPMWFVIGVLVTFAPEIARNDNVVLDGAMVVLVFYCGQAIGDLFNGALSQLAHSRKTAVLVFMVAQAYAVFSLFMLRHDSAAEYYAWFFLVGIANGYWTVFIAIAAEQFGINSRATVATTVPNMVRGSVAIMLPAVAALKATNPSSVSMLTVYTVVVLLAVAATHFLEETYGKDLNYLE